MTINARTALLVVALALFALAAWVGDPREAGSDLALGLAFLTAALIVG